MQVFQAAQQLSCEDRYVFFAEHTRFHLECVSELSMKTTMGSTRSEHEPPEQYSIMIHKLEPFK